MSDCDPPSGFGVVLFRSVQGAIKAERLLVAGRVDYKLIPVPRHLSSSCGFCLRFAWDDRSLVEDALSKADLGVEGIVPL